MRRVATIVLTTLATFCAGAQSSTGTVKWSAGNGYPPGPYSSPNAACATVLNGRRGPAEEWGPGAYYLISNAVANPAGWDLTPIDGYPYSATYCNFTQTIYACGKSCPYVTQTTNGLPYVYATSPPASCPSATCPAPKDVGESCPNGKCGTKNIRQRRPTTLNVNGLPYGVDVEIATGAAGDDALAHGAYLFRLKCSSDLSCSFQRVTLDKCTKGDGSNPALSTRVDTWLTSSGLLAVKQLSNSEIELTVYYQAFGNQLPAKVILTFASEGVPFKRLTNFRTTGFVDLRFSPDTNTGIAYVPIQNDRKMLLDCPIFLRGLTP